ncbi:hypothetical protein BDV26DRAFT_292553 [Aspergillus bertholletiae]|uniref:MYND-type domain-containing protein n=1 Tax=Aspergillus bertholletiae TaxID=1226010 RepID=A0A5N7B8J2_9EURO|nr:hypothetical protein BDV26DRAFT_292553 [Aspergillus bertholletiae]
MENPSTMTGSCAHCQSPATKKCSGCLGAPIYDEVVAETTFYCSSTCQKQGWEQHKVKCKQLQARKSLSRAATLLQDILYRIRLRAHTNKSLTAHMDGSRVILGDVHEDELDDYRPVGPLSIEVKGGDQRVWDAIVMMSACTEAVLFLFLFVRDILSNLCSRIDELGITVLNTPLSIERADGIPITCTENHHIYRLMLKNGEVWAFDPSGAQYGFSEYLCPWADYAKQRLGGVHHEANLGYYRSEMRRCYYHCDARYLTIWRMELVDLASALEEKIAILLQAYGGSLQSLLRGSDAMFERAKDELLNQLAICVDLCVDETYNPERVTTRSLLVDCQMLLWEVFAVRTGDGQIHSEC